MIRRSCRSRSSRPKTRATIAGVVVLRSYFFLVVVLVVRSSVWANFPPKPAAASSKHHHQRHLKASQQYQRSAEGDINKNNTTPSTSSASPAAVASTKNDVEQQQTTHRRRRHQSNKEKKKKKASTCLPKENENKKNAATRAKKKTKITALPSPPSTTSTSSNKKRQKQQLRPRSDRTRRLMSEWKDLISSGHAYNWKRGERVLPKKKKLKNKKNNSATGIINDAPLSSSSDGTSVEEEAGDGTYFVLGPLNHNNLNTWHFSLCGMTGSVYEGGLYHGILVLSPEYPAKPPLSIQVWTPSGRFVCRASICLSASRYHPETWNPSQWTLRTLVEGLRLHFLTTAQEIAGKNDSYEQRLAYAKQSRYWKGRLSHDIFVDHERMIRDGIFRGYLPSEEDSMVQEEETKAALFNKMGCGIASESSGAESRVVGAAAEATTPSVGSPDSTIAGEDYLQKENPTTTIIIKNKKSTTNKKKKHKKKKTISLNKPAFVGGGAGVAAAITRRGETTTTAAAAVAAERHRHRQQQQQSAVLAKLKKPIRIFVVGFFLILFLWLNH